MLFAERENLFAPSGRENESWFGVDRQTPEFLPELLRLFRLDSLSADSHQKSVCYFGCPVRRNNDSVTLPQAFEKLVGPIRRTGQRSEEHTSELQSHLNIVCRLLLEKKKNIYVCY